MSQVRCFLDSVFSINPTKVQYAVAARDLSWRAEAACRDLDTNLFFPDSDSDAAAAAALEVCAGCPVRQACLEFALNTRQLDGIWGGETEADRKRIRRQRRSAVA